MWNVPLRLLQKWELTRRLANRWVAFDSYEKYPFYVLHTDLFDWIGTLFNRDHTLDEVRSFYVGGPFDRVEVQEADPQWRVFARKTPALGFKFSV